MSIDFLSFISSKLLEMSFREWRQGGGPQSGLLNNVQPVHDSMPSPTVSASRKRQKTSQSLGAPPPSLHTQSVAAPSSSAAIRGALAGSKGKKTKSVCQYRDCPFFSYGITFCGLCFPFLSFVIEIFLFSSFSC